MVVGKDTVQLKSDAGEKALLGVPSECPEPTFHFNPQGGRDHLLGFDFPSVPGIPPVRDVLAGRFGAAAQDGAGQPSQLTIDEWKAHLSVICGEFRRADYHLARFNSVLEVLKARRRMAGGPVFGDPEPARALYCEAASYLSAVRTAVDVIVYVAARRSGASIAVAERWKASEAICAAALPPPPKYDTDDIRALRRHKNWFETLNCYRNSMLHRGWHAQSFGYFDRSDAVPQANEPFHNVMLVPDLGSLKQGTRPDGWTYGEKRWLDALVREIESGTSAAMEDLLQVWNLPIPKPGRLSAEDHSRVFLTVPLVPPIQGQSPPVLHVFLSEEAGRLFIKGFEKGDLELRGCSLREVCRTKLQGTGDGYLIAYDAAVLGSVAELHLHEVQDGRDQVIAVQGFCPSARNGPSHEILWFQMPTVSLESVFVLSHAG
jgi:hypothetical protein